MKLINDILKNLQMYTLWLIKEQNIEIIRDENWMKEKINHTQIDLDSFYWLKRDLKLVYTPQFLALCMILRYWLEISYLGLQSVRKIGNDNQMRMDFIYR